MDMDAVESNIDVVAWTEKVRAHLLERIAAGTIEVPPLPEVAMQVLSLTQSADADARRLADLIHRDAALAGNVLRMANSPAYMPREPIVSLQQAVSRLGFSTLCDIAFAVAVKGKVFDIKPFEAEARVLWKHALSTGLFAKEIARVRRRNVEGAFICGLLHDIGKPLILAAARNVASGGALPSGDALRPVLDQLHGVIGRELAARWNLSKQVAEAIEYHHDWPNAPTYKEVVAMTAFADELSYRILAEEGEGALEVEKLRALPVVAALNLYPDDLTTIVSSREKVLATMEATS